MSIDPSDPPDPPPIHEAPDESHEHIDDSNDDLTHVELVEAVAARRVPSTLPKKLRRNPNAQGASTLGFLRLENLPSDKGSGAAPLAVWIIVQLAAIAAAAGQWKFWAKEGVGASASIELLALQLLLIVQIVASTLIYPILLDGWAKLAWTIASAVAFQAIAWVMTGVPAMALVWAGGFVVMWTIGLAAWRTAVPGTVGTMFIRLLLVLLMLGWPIAMYLHTEFSDGGGGAGWDFGGPLAVVVRQLGRPALDFQTWATVAGFTAAGGALLLFRAGRSISWRKLTKAQWPTFR